MEYEKGETGFKDKSSPVHEDGRWSSGQRGEQEHKEKETAGHSKETASVWIRLSTEYKAEVVEDFTLLVMGKQRSHCRI